MTQLIILEGPDRCGKTTIAKHLARTLPSASYFHFGKPDPNLQALFGQHYQYKQRVEIWANRKYVVLDRSWISGLFYDYHRRLTVSQSYYADLGVLQNMLDNLNISVKLFFVHRPWNQELINEHQKELDTDPSSLPTTMQRRFIEHHSWPAFIHHSPFAKPQFTLTLEFNEAQSQANRVQSSQPEFGIIDPSTTIRFGQLDESAYRQAAYLHYFDLWAAHDWEACQCPRPGDLFPNFTNSHQ